MDQLRHIPQSAFGWVLSSIPLDYLDSAKARLEWRNKLMKAQDLPSALQILPNDHAALLGYQRCKKALDDWVALMSDLETSSWEKFEPQKKQAEVLAAQLQQAITNLHAAVQTELLRRQGLPREIEQGIQAAPDATDSALLPVDHGLIDDLAKGMLKAQQEIQLLKTLSDDTPYLTYEKNAGDASLQVRRLNEINRLLAEAITAEKLRRQKERAQLQELLPQQTPPTDQDLDLLAAEDPARTGHASQLKLLETAQTGLGQAQSAAHAQLLEAVHLFKKAAAELTQASTQVIEAIAEEKKRRAQSRQNGREALPAVRELVGTGLLLAEDQALVDFGLAGLRLDEAAVKLDAGAELPHALFKSAEETFDSALKLWHLKQADLAMAVKQELARRQAAIDELAHEPGYTEQDLAGVPDTNKSKINLLAALKLFQEALLPVLAAQAEAPRGDFDLLLLQARDLRKIVGNKETGILAAIQEAAKKARAERRQQMNLAEAGPNGDHLKLLSGGDPLRTDYDGAKKAYEQALKKFDQAISGGQMQEAELGQLEQTVLLEQKRTDEACRQLKQKLADLTRERDQKIAQEQGARDLALAQKELVLLRAEAKALIDCLRSLAPEGWDKDSKELELIATSGQETVSGAALLRGRIEDVFGRLVKMVPLTLDKDQFPAKDMLAKATTLYPKVSLRKCQTLGTCIQDIFDCAIGNKGVAALVKARDRCNILLKDFGKKEIVLGTEVVCEAWVISQRGVIGRMMPAAVKLTGAKEIPGVLLVFNKNYAGFRTGKGGGEISDRYRHLHVDGDGSYNLVADTHEHVVLGFVDGHIDGDNKTAVKDHDKLVRAGLADVMTAAVVADVLYLID